jgi:hypothetical protein
MFKQAMGYLIISIIVVMCAKYAHLLIVYIDMFYTYLNVTLAPIFSHSELGILIRKIITLVLLPVAIMAIPALIYYAIKGNRLPYFIQITWILWLVIVMSNILIG